MRIDFRVGGLRDLEQQARGAAVAVRDLASAQRELQSGPAGLSGGGSSPVRSGGGGGAGGGTGPRYLTGPAQRLARLDELEQLARQDKSPQAAQFLRDLPILRFRAQRSQILGDRRVDQGDTALQQPGLLDLFGTLNQLMSRRGRGAGGAAATQALQQVLIAQLGSGGGAGAAASATASSGVMAQIMAMLQGGAGTSGLLAGGAGAAALGPLGAVAATAAAAAAGLAAAAAAARGFREWVGGSASSTGSYRSGMTLSGGSAATVARLSGLGVDPGDAPGMAARLRSRLSLENADPHALAAAARLGLGGMLGRSRGPQDEARVLDQAIRGLRSLGETQEQLRIARQLELDAVLDTVNVSRRLQLGQDRLARLNETVYSESATRAGRENTEARRQGDALRRALGDAWGSGFTETDTAWQQMQNRLMGALVEPSARLGRGVNTLLGGLRGNLNAYGEAGAGFLASLGFGGSGGRGTEDPAEQIVRAIERQTRVLEEGLSGANARIRDAIAGSPMQVARALEAGALQGGVWPG